MKILVYGINYSPELTGIGKYTGEMVEWLAAQGHEVRVITAPPYYPQWQVGENYSAWRYKREEGAATVWRCPLYVPKTAEHPETPVASQQFCRQQFLSSDGATSLEAGSHYWRGANAVFARRECACWRNSLARVPCCIFRITKWTPCWGWALPEKAKAAKWHQLATAFERSGLHNVDNVSTISRSDDE
ncbi:putative colanic acid biosynthesis glycosyl transferase [Escherichia coli]|uniref:glycosyltransferase n=1 Tax=Escherichia coli TaxID=562 RepID=UPI000DFACE55|nr:glycosyltransferase [Escherichia coli]STL27877.1 putative colanic acid biosynthesis glycosyl transferase [Escherichia coli]